MGGNPGRWVRSLMFFENRMNATTEMLLKVLPKEAINRYLRLNPPPQGTLEKELDWRSGAELKKQSLLVGIVLYAIFFIILTSGIIVEVAENRAPFGMMIFAPIALMVFFPIGISLLNTSDTLRKSNEWFSAFLEDAQRINLESSRNYELNSLRAVTEAHLVRLATHVLYYEWLLKEHKRTNVCPEILRNTCEILIETRERFETRLKIADAFSLTTTTTRGYFDKGDLEAKRMIQVETEASQRNAVSRNEAPADSHP